MPALSVRNKAACCCRKPRTAGGAALQAGRLLLNLGDLDGAAALFAKAEASPQVRSEVQFEKPTSCVSVDRPVDRSPAAAEGPAPRAWTAALKGNLKGLQDLW